MYKNEYIVELTKLLLSTPDEEYTRGVMDAIRLAHQLNEYVPPTAGEVVQEMSKRDITIELIRKFFRVQISPLDERIIASHLNNKNEVLKAVKAYKDATGGTFGLKECKQDIDRVRTELGYMTRGEYESIWEKRPY